MDQGAANPVDSERAANLLKTGLPPRPGTRRGGDRAPDKAQDALDDFVLNYNDFLYALSDDTLTIKSHAKTYRIKATGATGKEDSRTRPQKAIENLERLRRGPPI